MIDIKTTKACPVCSYMLANQTVLDITTLAFQFHDTDLPPFLPNVPPRLVDFLARAIALFETLEPPKRKRKAVPEQVNEVTVRNEAEVKKLTRAGITLSLLRNHLPKKPTATELDTWASAVAVEFLEHLWSTHDQYILTYGPETRMRYLKRRILGYPGNPLAPKLRSQILYYTGRMADQFVQEKRKNEATKEKKAK